MAGYAMPSYKPSAACYVPGFTPGSLQSIAYISFGKVPGKPFKKTAPIKAGKPVYLLY
jgi:hypothetical protein